MPIATHTGVVTYSKIDCQPEKVSVVWSLTKRDNYWLAEGGIHFDLKTGKAVTNNCNHTLDLRTIKGVSHGKKVG